jgi:hypothetical protein
LTLDGTLGTFQVSRQEAPQMSSSKHAAFAAFSPSLISCMAISYILLRLESKQLDSLICRSLLFQWLFFRMANLSEAHVITSLEERRE